MIRDMLKKSQELPRRGSHMAKTAIVSTIGRLSRPGKSPDEAYLALFDDVQASKVYHDGKTFVDMIPREPSRKLARQYERQRTVPGFDIKTFVNRHFDAPKTYRNEVYHPTATTTAREHVAHLWDELKRRNRITRGSLLELPYEYIVPGGRFSEQFYWDSYFVMLGLAADNRWGIITGMMKNYQFMIGKFGYIPTANRSYLLSRSQPPFFAHMVQLVATHNGVLRTYAEYLPAMLREYRFWMRGASELRTNHKQHAVARVVRMPNGTILNRYFDNKNTPRPESRREDIVTAAAANTTHKEQVYVDLRAAAESGWDFSSRWFKDPMRIETIHTTDFVPIDLNCLLYDLEMTIADTYTRLKQAKLSRRFRLAAEARAAAIKEYCWDKHERFFSDYDMTFRTTNDRVTLAGVFALYSGIATPEQAQVMAARLEKDFLQPGGLKTTLLSTGQQWDAPNGWAPLQWVAVSGLKKYGFTALANTIRDRWLATNEAVFAHERRMVEKYDVSSPGSLGGGGEYDLQDGFGWTNGVYAAFKNEQEHHG